MRLFIHWLITAIALFVAVKVVPGITIQGTQAWVAVAVMAVILSLVNVFIKPFLKFLSCGFIVLTLGLFMLVINALTLWLSSAIAQSWFDIGFVVNGFMPALLGSIIVSVVSFLLSMFLVPDKR